MAGLLGGYLIATNLIVALRIDAGLALLRLGPPLLAILLAGLAARKSRRFFTVADVWIWGMVGALPCVLAGLGLSVLIAGSGPRELPSALAYAGALACAWAGLQLASGGALLAHAFRAAARRRGERAAARHDPSGHRGPRLSRPPAAIAGPAAPPVYSRPASLEPVTQLVE